MRSRALSLALILMLTGCKSAPTTQAADTQISTVLFFGLSKPNGSLISQDDFNAFAAREIAPRFPDGYTILHGDGHWREKGRDISEPSCILWLIHPESPKIDASLEELRAAYCRQFQQTSVLRMDQPASKVLF